MGVDNFIESFSGSQKYTTAVATSIVIQVMFSAKRKIESPIHGIEETLDKEDNPITDNF